MTGIQPLEGAELEAQMERLDLGVLQVDAHGELVRWSKGAARITGFSAETALGHSWTDLTSSDEGFGEITELLEHPEELPEGAQPFELRFTTHGSRHLHIYGSLVPLWEGRRFVGLLGAFQDVTQLISRKRFAPLPESHQRTSLLGESGAMNEVRNRIELAARTEVTVFVSGESGTGKELAARAVHNSSERRDKPFVAVNCSAIPESLLESELFGHVEGAFTGAVRDHAGIFEEATGGTVFLDEIGDIGPLMQVKLLRVLEDRTLRRVGGSEEIPIDVRLITATHQNLKRLVEKGSIRQDFFYRIRVFEIALPPLRARRDDIPELVGHFIRELSERWQRQVTGVTEEALGLMLHYPWPGNVRELRNAIEHAFVTVSKDRIGVRDLPAEIRAAVNPALAATQFDTPAGGADEVERVRILDALDACDWNRTRAAERLGISRVTLWKRMRKYSIDEGIVPVTSLADRTSIYECPSTARMFPPMRPCPNCARPLSRSADSCDHCNWEEPRVELPTPDEESIEPPKFGFLDRLGPDGLQLGCGLLVVSSLAGIGGLLDGSSGAGYGALVAILLLGLLSAAM